VGGKNNDPESTSGSEGSIEKKWCTKGGTRRNVLRRREKVLRKAIERKGLKTFKRKKGGFLTRKGSQGFLNDARCPPPLPNVNKKKRGQEENLEETGITVLKRMPAKTRRHKNSETKNEPKGLT